MNSSTISQDKTSRFTLGAWQVDPDTNRLHRPGETKSVEPKVMGLLLLLASKPKHVFTRTDIEAALWPKQIVGEDSLPRTVSKLRNALGDSASAPAYIETIPKRGYRLLVSVEQANQFKAAPRSTPLLIALALVTCLLLVTWQISNQSTKTTLQPNSENQQTTQRADDLYSQFNRADNESAIALYERIIASDNADAQAHAGLANALVQRVIRWSETSSESPSITKALATGLTETADAQATLSKAVSLAERAARLSPNNPDVLKALGLSYAAQGELDRAEQTYLQAIKIDKNAWASLLNLGEIHQIRGEQAQAIKRFEQAYAAMGRTYEQEPQRVGLWQADVGILVGDLHGLTGDLQKAERWYRRVLEQQPFDPNASIRLVHLLMQAKREQEANTLCVQLEQRLGANEECQRVLQQ